MRSALSPQFGLQNTAETQQQVTILSTMFTTLKKRDKYLSVDGANALLSSPVPELWFRLPNRLNDQYDSNSIGSYADAFGAIEGFCMSESASARIALCIYEFVV